MENEKKDNLEVLSELLKYQGFGEDPKLLRALEENVRSGKKDFQLAHEGQFKDQKTPINAVLHFRRSDQTGQVYFNKYDATVNHENDPSKSLTQTFYITNGIGVTLKEAFNLLEGRPVKRDMMDTDRKKYNAWLQLDFTQKDTHNNYKMDRFTEGYGFDAKEKIEKLPIKFTYDDGASRLQKSLEKGNIAQVTYSHNGHTVEGTISLNARFKSVNESKTLRDFRKEHMGEDTSKSAKKEQDGAPKEKRKSSKKDKTEEPGEAVTEGQAPAGRSKRK